MSHRERLELAGRHVVTLTWTGGDFPWVHGSWEPGPGFPLLEAFLRPSTVDGRLHLDDNTLAAEHPPQEWLLTAEGEEPVFLHTLVLSPGGHAAWRFGPDPSDVG
ncbi:hypothetical protein GCM10010399_28650 [Dactylosporangium fulvum]|uniref:Uncharacterized protein n=1 Tax=Dactylosporangium fulvum TaxID=53359 RepID=A0ABY5WA90_9ACTN|nr:hypothetical protein [Dactylosporangium fulvum]UWP86265.1 hypothetical protein Dfulv_19285 [Dactylosporangium fulvum]